VSSHIQSASTTRQTRAIAVGANATLAGDLVVPANARGLVIFGHADATMRMSPGARALADALDRREVATIVVDLLTEAEEAIDQRTGKLRFDMSLLANRLMAICSWAHRLSPLRGLPVGLLGGHTAGGAALVAAAQQPPVLRTVVSFSGRADLAGSALRRVMVPTLFIVGGRDDRTAELTSRAVDEMHNDARVAVVPDARNGFEEPGALDQVGRLSSDWFAQRLGN
jgi:putative phosphoribosyl transferase